ncbi:MAG: LytTR family DNA-binding domain-containing protein [Saprospiraceae bacterium]|nr:LytTR family DNA-binding domain-containing protein [Saprospiraceae bacterium]
MKVVIIEDELVAAQNMQLVLQEYDPTIEVLAVLRSVKKAVAWLSQGLAQVDLLLMDIKLTDGISFDIFDQVAIKKPIIFTTAYDEYAIRAFKVNSVDYLLKPISLPDLSTALDKWKAMNPPALIDYQALARQLQLQSPPYRTRFLVKQGSLLQAVPVEDIAYFWAQGNLVLLRTIEGKSFPVNYALDSLGDQLDPQHFFRITRGVIVHIQAIQQIHTYFKGRLKVTVLPALEEELIVSNRKLAAFKAWANR